MNEEIEFDYMKVPLEKYTFQQDKIRKWVERNSDGRVLNLFAGKTELDLNEVRNDLNEDMPTNYNIDAFELVKKLSKEGERFDTVILDPPYSYRKSMEKYNGNVASNFKRIKDKLPNILKDNEKVITFGYHSVSMGESRGFKQKRILLMSHGGAIHDTIVIIEQKLKSKGREDGGEN